MTESEIRTMADNAVAAGTATRQQVDQWIAADVAALKGEAPTAAPAAQSGQGATIQARAAALVTSGEWTQAQADAALAAYAAAPLPADAPAQAASSATPKAASSAPDPFAGVDLGPDFGPPAKPEDYGIGRLI